MNKELEAPKCEVNNQHQTPEADEYPGDDAYNQKIQTLLEAFYSDQMDFPWHGATNVTREQLCEGLVELHYGGTLNGMTVNNAEWLGCNAFTPVNFSTILLDALMNPKPFDLKSGWADWEGHHQGNWYSPTQVFSDEAIWSPPVQQPTSDPVNDLDSNNQPRVYDFQEVVWPARQVGNHGWNQSHHEVPYIWGWDPKENGNENGDIGTHVGFPFSIDHCKFIVWITPKAAFLEGINLGTMETKTINGQQVSGHPKTSTAFTDGFGQWLIA